MREFPHVDGFAGPETVVMGDDREDTEREERLPLQRRTVWESADGDVDEAPLDEVEETSGAVFDELNLNVRAQTAITGQQLRDEALEGLGGGADTKNPRRAGR